MTTEESKRGDSFRREFIITDANGAAVDISAMTASAQMRFSLNGLATRPDAPVAQVTATIIPETTGLVALTAPPTVTAGWSPGLWLGDVQLTSGTDVWSTKTFGHRIVEDITP